jgi:acetyl-CoA acyltransferase 2
VDRRQARPRLPGGAFADVSAIGLGAVAVRGAIERAGIDLRLVDHAVMGNALQTSGDPLYGARHVALEAGLPEHVPALTVSRLCGSGLQSVATAAQMLRLDEAARVVASGMGNLSQAPRLIRGAGASPSWSGTIICSPRPRARSWRRVGPRSDRRGR